MIHPKAFRSSIIVKSFLVPQWHPNSIQFMKYACAKGHAGCNVMTPQCHVTIPLKINMISLDLSRLNGVKLYDRK